MKHFYIRELHGGNIPVTPDVAQNLLSFMGYSVYEETDSIVIITQEK